MRLWAESLSAYRAHASATSEAEPAPAPVLPDSRSATLTEAPPATRTQVHPFCASSAELAQHLNLRMPPEDDAHVLRMRLPSLNAQPLPSDQLASLIGRTIDAQEMTLAEFDVASVSLRPADAIGALLRYETQGPPEGIEFAASIRYWTVVSRFVLELLVDQRFVPTLIRDGTQRMQAAWHPWLHDAAAEARVAALIAACPPIARAAVDSNAGDVGQILQEAMTVLADALTRAALIQDDFCAAVRDREIDGDAHVVWCRGLLDHNDIIEAPADLQVSLLDGVRGWIGRLGETGRDHPFYLSLRLDEPPVPAADQDSGSEIPDTDAPTLNGDDENTWRLHVLLRGADDEDKPPVDAQRIWKGSPASQVLNGRRLDRPHEFLLTELGRASRLYPRLEAALADAHPASLPLATAEVVELLREYRPLLEESGIEVTVPEWWDRRSRRLGLRLHIDPETSATGSSSVASVGAPSRIGLNALVRYRWEVAVGDQSLSLEEIRRLAHQTAPLVRIGDRWVELGPDDLEAAAQLLEQPHAGEMTLGEAMEIVRDAEHGPSNLPVFGFDTSGWAAQIFESDAGVAIEQLEQPSTFIGSLRPYQRVGLSWLVFLEKHGLGACLADDMGLGKTIQLIALLLHERETGAHPPAPTLLVVPTSVVENWARELTRFAPSLTYHVHHGPDRPQGEVFEEIALTRDVVITTYSLVPRDRDTLFRLNWQRVVLDEAQYIKNPPTKQATTIRTIPALHRIAMTGTPVENRLSELWSIMDFCNPGYLGLATQFRQRFAIPVERHRDRERGESLRRLVQPFILRRLKSDPKVAIDLPSCVETREYATLTPQQAALYQNTVEHMLSVVDEADGMKRRGLVLATLTRLKQICNHPANRTPPDGDRSSIPENLEGQPLSRRSGKCRRLIEMLDEVLAAGDRALVFTQYRRMGHLLEAMIRHDLDGEVLYMHGGTPRKKRQQLIDRFQEPSTGPTVFILSLKAGGVGLNLTAANHVFHFDRWWNPAVEKQATDRAFRIGQTRTVHVHKFVCIGTLEEQIDRMIEEKTALADNILGSGEQWVTELSTDQLRDVLRLRETAMEGDD